MSLIGNYNRLVKRITQNSLTYYGIITALVVLMKLGIIPDKFSVQTFGVTGAISTTLTTGILFFVAAIFFVIIPVLSAGALAVPSWALGALVVGGLFAIGASTFLEFISSLFSSVIGIAGLIIILFFLYLFLRRK